MFLLNFQMNFFFLYFSKLFERTLAFIKESIIYLPMFLNCCESWWWGRDKQQLLSRKMINSH